MQRLDMSAVRQWRRANVYWCPASVSTVCYGCNETAVFTVDHIQMDPERNTVSASAACPSCEKTMHFWLVDAGKCSDESQRGNGTLMAHPDPGSFRKCLEVDRMPQRVLAAYTEAVSVFRGRNWNATASMCRRTLEGLLIEILPEDKRKGTLAEQVKNLKDHVDLVGPLVAVSDSLRKGGNLGSHFDEKIDADEDIATVLVDFIDYLVEYVYILPDSTEKLKNRLTQLDSSG